jgi:hypothetical protein
MSYRTLRNGERIDINIGIQRESDDAFSIYVNSRNIIYLDIRITSDPTLQHAAIGAAINEALNHLSGATK